MTLEELQRGGIAECLVWADRVVSALPNQQLAIDLQQIPASWSDFVKFLVVCAMGTFNAAVEFGRAGRQHEQRQQASLTALLEFGSEFGESEARTSSSTAYPPAMPKVYGDPAEFFNT